MEDSKDSLVRAVSSQERQVIHVRGQVEANRKKVDELDGKLQMVADVVKLSEEAKANQPTLDRSVNELNRLLMRVEALAESENSRNSSNEQVRQINEEIGKAHEELTLVEQQLIQSEADCKAVESEIQSAQFEFDNRAGGAAIRLEQAYKTIQDTRQEIAAVRRQTLRTFLEREDKLAKTEIDNQRLTTSLLLYKQLVLSLQQELQVLNDDNKRELLQTEVTKFEQAIQAVPQRQPLPAEVRQAEEQACSAILAEIEQATDEVKSTLSRMAAAEKMTDGLNADIRKAQDINDKLRRETAEADERIESLRREIENLQMQDASSAAREIDRLGGEIDGLVREEEAIRARITELRQSQNAAFQIPPNMLKLVERMRTDGQRVESRMQQLINERVELEVRVQKLRAQQQQQRQEAAFGRRPTMG